MRKVYVRTKAVSEIFWVGKKIQRMQSMYDALIVFIFLLFFHFFFVQLDNNKRVVCRIAHACHTCGAPADLNSDAYILSKVNAYLGGKCDS